MQSQTSTIAAPPFDRSNADLVLRSSDNIDFHTYKVILALASPVFEDMSAMPQPPATTPRNPSDSKDGVPVVLMTEESHTLDRLLRFCYPGPDLVFSNVADSVGVLEAAHKYDIKDISNRMSRVLETFLADNPLTIYAIASRFELAELIQRAASLARERGVNKLQYVPEMDHISAAALYRLLQYCHRPMATGWSWTSSHGTWDKVPTFNIPAPLTSHPFCQPCDDSDIILQSSDGVRFHVVSSILRLSSPVFAALIGRLSPVERTFRSDFRLNPRIIYFSENSHRLALILQLCYPMSDPPLPEHLTLHDIVYLAGKYKVPRLTDYAKRETKSLASGGNPLAAYLTATSSGWEDVAREAAKIAAYTWDDGYSPFMETATAKAYHRLLLYRFNCRTTVNTVLLGSGCSLEDKRCLEHWSKCTVYQPEIPISHPDVIGFHERVDVLQMRFAMMTVASDAPSAFVTVAPVSVKFSRNAYYNDIVLTSRSLAPKLKNALLEVEL